MSKSVIRLLTLAITTALVAGPTVTPASAATSHSKPVKKHRMHFRDSRDFSDHPLDRAWTAMPPGQAGEVCPGIARSFDCKIWPPPIGEDPDRKMSGSDGG